MFYRATLLFLSLLLLNGCGSGGGSRNAMRIGIDPDWYPIDFGLQGTYINAFTEELLLEISRSTGIEFERIPANWNTLYEGMDRKQYDAVLSSMPPYDFNVAKYDFSINFLDLGPVLIVPTGGEFSDLNKMAGKHVGVVNGDAAGLIVQQYPGVILRDTYPSISNLLLAVVDGEIEGALLNWIPAVNYLSDLFAGKLSIASAPLDHSGLHLVVLKGKHSRLVAQFNKSVEFMKKKKKMQKLLEKWQLA